MYMYRARRSEIQVSKNNGKITADRPAYNTVDHGRAYSGIITSIRSPHGTPSTIGQSTRGLLLLYFPFKHCQNRFLPFIHYNEVHVVTSTSYHGGLPMR